MGVTKGWLMIMIRSIESDIKWEEVYAPNLHGQAGDVYAKTPAYKYSLSIDKRILESRG